MNKLALLWSLLTGKDRAEMDDHERHILILERKSAARSAFRRVAEGGDGK